MTKKRKMYILKCLTLTAEEFKGKELGSRDEILDIACQYGKYLTPPVTSDEVEKVFTMSVGGVLGLDEKSISV